MDGKEEGKKRKIFVKHNENIHKKNVKMVIRNVSGRKEKYHKKRWVY